MLQIIIIVAGIIGFIYLNNRISEIQNSLLKNNVSPKIPRQQEDVIQSSILEEKPQFSYSAPDKISTDTLGEETGGRWLGKIGIAALFVGVAFFLKYAFDNNLIGVVGRIILGIFVGALLLAVGQYLRKKYSLYSDVLIGGGVGVLYLTVYAAFAFYNLINQPVSFICIGIITIIGVGISIANDSKTTSIISLCGGFLTPLLISFDSTSLFSLFAYIASLDLGMLAISLKKKWLELVYLTFAGTVLLVCSWYNQFYTHQLFSVMFLFVTIYFLIFLGAIFIRHIWKKEQSSTGDIMLIAINALGYFAFTYNLIDPIYHDFRSTLALVLGIVYTVLSYISFKNNSQDKAINLYLPGISILFFTLAISFQFTGSWITLSWLFESLILFCIAFYSKQKNYQIFGVIVYVLTIIRLFTEYLVNQTNTTPFFNERFVLFILAIIVAYIISYLYSKNPSEDVVGTPTSTILVIFLVVANLLTIYIVTTEIIAIFTLQIQVLPQADYYLNVVSIQNQSNTVVSIVWTLYATILIAIGFIMRSRVFRIFGLVFFFVTAFKVSVDVWSLGELYRIISSIVFGIVALIASFVYAKYKHRITQMIIDK